MKHGLILRKSIKFYLGTCPLKEASSYKRQAPSACDILSRVIFLLDMNCHNSAIIVIYNI